MMSITSGLVLGIVYAAAPGPVNVETLRRGMKAGLCGALALQAGSGVGRIAYALLALIGSGFLLQGATLQPALGVFGMAVLFYLGIAAIRDRRALAGAAGDAPATSGNGRRAFWSGAVLSLSSPMAIVFWLSIGGRVAHEPGLDAPAFLLGFFGGCLLASLAVAIFASFWQSRLTARAVLAVSWVCGLVLIAFGVRLGLATGLSLIAR